MFATMCRQAHIIWRSRHHWRSQHHLAVKFAKRTLANIIQKSLICLVDKLGFFVGRGRRDRSASHPACGARRLDTTISRLSTAALRYARFFRPPDALATSPDTLRVPRVLFYIKKDTAKAMSLAGAEGIEPSALGFGDRCSTS